VSKPSFKARLRAGRPAGGCFLELFSPLVAEIVAAAGYESVMIDLEHGPGSPLEVIALLQAIQGRDCAPLLRVETNHPVPIKRVLDLGLAGIMIPAISSPVEAQAAVAACRYPPRGVRGMAAPIVRATGYGASWEDYVAGGADELLVMCQIETAAGLEQVEAIAAVDGVDMLFVGPFDLSANLGHMGRPDHPEVRAAIARVEAAAKAAGRLLGNIPTPERDLAALFDAGYDLVIGDCDNQLLRAAAEEGAGRIKSVLEEGASS
jgi:2-keto-3-deoxy-L-rhamnonate aldolase RhmA